jgi:DNA-binding SARP family transcriptional activator
VAVSLGAPLALDVTDIAQAQRLLRCGQGSSALLKPLEHATSAYHGPFLDGVAFPDAPDFEAWMRGQRVRWLDVQSELLDSLASLSLADGRPAPARLALERLTSSNPDHELGWRRLLELHLESGDASAARRTWRAYQEAMSLLEAAPSAEMMSLAELTGAVWAGRR